MPRSFRLLFCRESCEVENFHDETEKPCIVQRSLLAKESCTTVRYKVCAMSGTILGSLRGRSQKDSVDIFASPPMLLALSAYPKMGLTEREMGKVQSRSRQ